MMGGSDAVEGAMYAKAMGMNGVASNPWLASEFKDLLMAPQQVGSQIGSGQGAAAVKSAVTSVGQGLSGAAGAVREAVDQSTKLYAQTQYAEAMADGHIDEAMFWQSVGTNGMGATIAQYLQDPTKRTQVADIFQNTQSDAELLRNTKSQQILRNLKE